jgi:ABC-type multidrug transport system fused ATPase/permease subunit
LFSGKDSRDQASEWISPKEILNHYRYFYSYLSYRIPLFLVLGILAAFLDGFGLVMFLPMLKLIADSVEIDHKSDFEIFGFNIQSLGIELTLSVVLFTMLGFFTLKGIVKYLEIYVSTENQRRFVVKLRMENIENLARYRFDKFIIADAGKIQNTMSGEVSRVVGAFRAYMGMLHQSFMIFVYTFLAFSMNAQFAVFVLVGAAFTNLLFNNLYRMTKMLSRKIISGNDGYQGLLIQQVAFFKYLKATGQINKYGQKLIRKIVEIEEANKKIGIISGRVQGAKEPLLIFILVLAILIQVNIFETSLALILISILFFYRALTSVTQLQMSYVSFLSSSESLNNIQEFNQTLKNGKELEGSILVSEIQSGVELENVSYAYSSQGKVLNNISLKIKKNESIAFVGESGAGKTTLMNIAAGLLEPSEGRVLINGIDSKKIKLDSYRSLIGYITQEPVIFDDDIFDNVTFGDERNQENTKRMWQALEMANLKEFVEQLREQEKSRLGNNGINLSGGQRQRIAIARELYKEVEILFMDEATSSLDSETERVIQENIDMLKGMLTIVIIAHRLSTIKGVDRVVVLKNGSIECIGSYSDVVQTSGSFQKMNALQKTQLG